MASLALAIARASNQAIDRSIGTTCRRRRRNPRADTAPPRRARQPDAARLEPDRRKGRHLFLHVQGQGETDPAIAFSGVQPARSRQHADNRGRRQEDTEPILQHPITSIADCQVQMLAHRKQGPVLPTLVLSILPDPLVDKARKRRSSRTAAFSTPRETGPTTLLFRPGLEEYPTLQDWARFIQQLIQPQIPDRLPLSPVTPASPTFINPFAPRSREPSDMFSRPESRNGGRPGFVLKNPGPTHTGRDRPVTFSDSPSLRSKRSDLSSQTSSVTQSHVGYHNYAAVLPADLPSPATTIGEYQGEFIEGWTSAQGRSSALSSPIRGRESVSSQTPNPLPPILDSELPPGPRETILDRAFQLRCIPGSEREVPGEEKLSSLARFEALMREVDEKRKHREAEEAKSKPQDAVAPSAEPRSAFDDDDSDSDDDSTRDSDDDSDGMVPETDVEDQFPSSQRALDFLTGRYESTQRQHQLSSRGYGVRSPPSYNHEAFMALSNSASAQMRPHTGYSKNRSRPGMTQRTHSQPHLAAMLASSSTPLETIGSDDGTGFSFTPGSPSALQRSSTEMRQSASSVKRLSFGEFTRRLSSTSSLLLMQTNASAGGSSRASHSDMDLQLSSGSPPPHLHHLHPRAGPSAPLQQQQIPPLSPLPAGERERCAWRGSVGVFGTGEGGFV